MTTKYDLREGFEPPAGGRTPKLRVEDLGVLNVYPEDRENMYLKIWQDSIDLPMGETCYRNVVFGPAQDIEQVELPSERNVPMRSEAKFLQGGPAYGFLLRLVTGLESKREGDSHIAYQFKEGWSSFSKLHADKSKQMDPLIQRLISDARVITSNLTKDIRTQNIETAAKIINGHKAGQRVIIIGDVGENKDNADYNSSMTTRGVARALSVPGKTGVSEIGIVHPDAEVRAKIIEEFEDLKQRGKLDKGLMLHDIAADKLATAFEVYDSVYCCLPMEKEPAFDAAIISAWKGRERQDNRFAHLRGAVALQGVSSPAFTEAEKTMSNYFSPEMVMETNASIGMKNRTLRAKAEALVDFISAQRLQGVNVRYEDLVHQGFIDGEIKRPGPKHD